MPSFPVIRTMLREFTTSELSPRIPEPDLVMDDPDKVAAYTRAGREDGVMAPVYLYHCAQICEVILPGDLVVDLACGPATQLAQVARLNPDVRFIGVDLSEPMLQRAEDYIRTSGLNNVSLQQGDISDLSMFNNESIDAAMSTMALHHLPDSETLFKTFSEIERVLKPSGGIYLADFAHLKSEKSIDYFANQYADRQPELFTLDYLYSLRAAFSKSDFRQAIRLLKGKGGLHFPLFPFMIAVKSPARRQLGKEINAELSKIHEAMPANHKVDFQDLKMIFRLGGLKSPKFS